MPQLVSVWYSVTPQMQIQDFQKYLRTKYGKYGILHTNFQA
jgi:hypothetical protein